MKFASRVFLIAGIYGILLLAPMYFLEGQVAKDFPPAITHPEYFYGFIGVALAWQIAFLIMSRDPARYRLIMLPAIVEKFSYGVAVVTLFFQGRLAPIAVGFGVADLLLGCLFIAAFLLTRPVANS